MMGRIPLHVMTSSKPPDTWTVWRQDDSGNKDVVSRGHTREDGERAVREFEARGHKQTYWIERDPADPYDLNRFVRAQEIDYDRALSEIRDGRKRSHWMWYIFPQLAGLGFSSTAQHYAIGSLAEAGAYLRHPQLGPRLLSCAEAALAIEGRSAAEVFGSPDDLKLRSCATLFAILSPPGSVFERLLDKYFHGERDQKTIQLIDAASSTP
jgi:uncharacterized protein (DUF1810 family)